jgi:hypothetical protein
VYKRTLHTIGLILAGLFFIPVSGSAQQAAVSASLDSNTMRIGEQTILKLKVSLAGEKPGKVSWPLISDTIIKNIQVVRVSKTDTVYPNVKRKFGDQEQIRYVHITSFDSGYYAIPPFRFFINGDSSKPYLTEAMLLHVQGMKVDTTLAIKDIKQPLKEPFSWRELIPYIKWIILAAVLLIGFVLLIHYAPRRKKAVLTRREPAIAPHVVALEKLQKLREKKLWQEGKQKEYHSELTEILRWYIEQRFRIPAMEQTSDEIISSFRSISLGQECKSRLSQVLLLSDMIKFAKQQALPDENEMSMNNAVSFVREAQEETSAPEGTAQSDSTR